MKTFFAAALAAASVHATGQLPDLNEMDPYCCEFFNEENYGGESEEFCLKRNVLGILNDSDAMSFIREEMNDQIKSFKCGMEVGLTFCDLTYTQSFRGGERS